jgi:hypothetical protein
MLKSTSASVDADCIRAGYFFHLAYPIGWAAAHLVKKRQTTLKAPQGIGKTLHKLISWAMILDDCLMPGCVPGMSALACFSLRRNGRPAEE